jgi:hypothetical protein
MPGEPASGGFFKWLLSALRAHQRDSPDSAELLDEHEVSLRKLYPNGRPSGDGSEQFDRLSKLREEEVDWQTRHRRRLQLVALCGAIATLAIAIAIAAERLAG